MTNAVTSFDRATLRKLDVEMMAALERVCKPLGLQVRSAGGRFSDFEFTAKFTVTINSTEALESKADEEKANWNAFAPMYGLKPEWFGREFVSGRATFRIAGFLPSRSKYPVLGVRADGKRLLFPAETIKMKFEKHPSGTHATR